MSGIVYQLKNLMYSCERCGKSAQVGMKVSHSHRRTKKRSMPNLHKITLSIGGRRQSMSLCTKCLRLEKKKYTLTLKDKLVVGTTESSGVKVTAKVEKTGTLSEAIEKSANKASKKIKKSVKVSQS